MKLLHPNAIWLSNIDIDNEKYEICWYENIKYKLYDYILIGGKEAEDLKFFCGATQIEIMLYNPEYWFCALNKFIIVYDCKIFDLTNKNHFMASINKKWSHKEFVEYFKKRLLLL